MSVVTAPDDPIGVVDDTTTEPLVPDQAAAEEAGTVTKTCSVLRAHGVGVKGGVSGNAVAKRAGLNAETVNRYLRPVKAGRKLPTMDKATIDAIADAIPMSRQELQAAVLSDQGFIVDQAAGPPVSVDGVLAALPGLSDRDRRIVLAELAQMVAREGPAGH